MSQELETALKVLTPAMLASLAFLLAAWRPWQRASLPRHGQWGAALAIGTAFLAAFFVVAEWRGVQLKDRWHWLAPIVLAATLLGLTAALWRPGRAGMLSIALATGIAAALLVNLPPAVNQPALWRIGLAAIVFAMWSAVEPVAQRRGGASIPLAMVIVFGGLSMLLLETHQAGFSLLAAALSAACGMSLLIALLNPHLTFAGGASYVIAAAFPSLLAIGWIYNRSEVGAWPFALMLVAPLMLWLGELEMVRRRADWLSALLRAMAVAAPIVLAMLLALRSATTQDDYYY